MVDILNKEIVVGDKVIYIPKHEHKLMLRYGIVTKLTKNNNRCYCTALNIDYNETLLKQSHEIYKID